MYPFSTVSFVRSNASYFQTLFPFWLRFLTPQSGVARNTACHRTPKWLARRPEALRSGGSVLDCGGKRYSARHRFFRLRHEYYLPVPSHCQHPFRPRYRYRPRPRLYPLSFVFLFPPNVERLPRYPVGRALLLAIFIAFRIRFKQPQIVSSCVQNAND